jgi:hypothetical protein
MKKLITSSLASLFLITATATADVGLNVGITGSMGLFGAHGREAHSDTTSASSIVGTQSASEIAAVGYASVFIEKTLGDFISVGIEYVPTPFESETTETAKNDKDGSETVNRRSNKVQVDLEDLSTLYLALNVTEDAFVKIGAISVDVITNENMGTGATYGNTSLDGTMIGIGYDKDISNGLFIRAEGNYMNFDGASLTSGDNTISLRSLDGVTGKLSIGKSF